MSELFSDHAAARLFEFVDRGETNIPANYLPLAPGVMFAGEEILSAVGHAPGSYRPHGWRRHRPGDYRKPVGKHHLVVRQCGSPRSVHWTIERVEPWADKGIEALVFPFGNCVPISARTYQAAMRVAEYCYPIARLPVFARWEFAR